MIRVKVNGTDEKEVLEGTVGMTVKIVEKDDYWMDGGWAGIHYEAYYIDFDCHNIKKVILDKFNDAVCDCSEETYNKWFEEVRKPYLVAQALKKHHEECKKVDKGKLVIVMRGRKVAIGTKGKVFWIGNVNCDHYGRSWGVQERVGIKDDNGNIYWTASSNCEVVDPTVYYEDEDIIEMVNANIDNGRLY